MARRARRYGEKERWRDELAATGAKKDGEASSPLQGQGFRLFLELYTIRISMWNFARRQNRLPRLSYVGANAYFLTLCARDRRRHFANSCLVETILAILRDACARNGFQLHAYCFMPDHLHLILTAQCKSADLVKTMQVFKSLSSVESWQIRRVRSLAKIFPRSHPEIG